MPLSTHATRPHAIEIRVDVADGARIDCWARNDLGRDRVAVHLADGEGHAVVLVLNGAALCDLYVELRRFLGELGGHGPSRDEARRAVDAARRSTPSQPVA